MIENANVVLGFLDEIQHDMRSNIVYWSYWCSFCLSSSMYFLPRCLRPQKPMTSNMSKQAHNFSVTRIGNEVIYQNWSTLSHLTHILYRLSIYLFVLLQSMDDLRISIMKINDNKQITWISVVWASCKPYVIEFEAQKRHRCNEYITLYDFNLHDKVALIYVILLTMVLDLYC